MQKITPFLWFDGRAEEAAEFCTAIFKNSKIIRVSPTSAVFDLAGQKWKQAAAMGKRAKTTKHNPKQLTRLV